MLCALTKKQSAAIENSEVGSESESDSTIANNCQGEFDWHSVFCKRSVRVGA